MYSPLEELLMEQIRQAQMPEPVREVRFHPPRRFRFDLAWVNERLAVEVNGAIYTAGRHSRGSGLESDYEKLNQAQIDGWCVLQFSGHQIKNGYALKTIEYALNRFT